MSESLKGDPLKSASLNQAQAEAAQSVDGALLILAGAGTGKTKTLTTRIALLLSERRAYPSQILALTFTNKAASEMRARVLKATENSAGESMSESMNESMPWLGTFHSICAKMLRMMLQKNVEGLAQTLPQAADFSIIDDSDQKRIIKEILKSRNLDEKAHPAGLLLHFIQRWKDKGLLPEGVKLDSSEEPNLILSASVWREYQKRLGQLNAMDFGDLINFCVMIFRKHPALLEQWQEKFKFILVDEYQDTNQVQHILLKLLAGERQNICCVGDDDQSIYGWRGAQVKNILEFQKTYPRSKVIRLEQNYRSTKHILGAADTLIAHNEGRLGKKLWTQIEGGNKIAVWEYLDGKDEARQICTRIIESKIGGNPLSSIAILVRASWQIRLFEEQCLAKSIPYRIVGALRFYERAEIRDANGYFRLIAQEKDDLAFRRIVNQPKRQIGKTTVDALVLLARKEGCSLLQASNLPNEKLLEAGIKARASTALKTFAALIKRLHFSLEQVERGAQTLDGFAREVIEKSELKAMWQAQKQAGGQTQLDNLNELARAIGEFSSLEDYLEHIALVMEREQRDSQTDSLNIMTLHAAKGLEFDCVFLPGWEEELFPHVRSLAEPNGIEEERRLAYVGITRAREEAVVSFAQARLTFSDWRANLPSRFIKEMGDAHVIFHPSTSSSGIYSGTSGVSDFAQSENVSEEVEKKRIYHEHFGDGTIIETNGDNLTIRFDNGTKKMIKASFVQFI